MAAGMVVAWVEGELAGCVLGGLKAPARGRHGDQPPPRYWINDTFNASSASSPRYGQLIKANAAAVRLQPRTVAILDGNGEWAWANNSSYSTSRCVNFGTLRNNNYKFEVTAYNTVN
ncbi:hypothetical protein ACWD04_31390 [Streptomyces sp. NPDC002911]